VDAVRSLYWHQGLFLQPQHFQQLQLQVDSAANAYSGARTGVYTGISNLQIDEAALKGGLFKIDAMDCVLSDGTLLRFPGNCSLSPLSLTGLDPDDSGAYEIFLGLAPLGKATSNLSQNDKGSKKRFLLNDTDVVPDMFDHHESIDIATLNYDVQLLVGREALADQGFVIEKIAEIMADGTGYSLSKTFVGNINTIQCSPLLMSAIKTTRQSLIARYEQLESFSSLAGGHTSELSASTVSNMMALSVIAAYVPTFSHFADVPNTSPQQLYLSLRQLVAQLSAFSKRVSLVGDTGDTSTSLLAYQPNNLGDCFQRAFKLVNVLLDELTIAPELLIELAVQGDGKYVNALTNDFIESSNRVYIRLRTSEDIDSKVDEILQYAKLGADLQVDIYMKRSLPGVKLDYLARKPLGVASTPNSYYFALDRHSFEWQKVADSTRIGFVWAGAPDDLTVEIIAVKG